MSEAELAYIARAQDRLSESLTHFRLAFESEKEAAELSHLESGLEPSRSILLRSAASLALEVSEYREAERLVSLGLSGSPPEPVADELRDILERVNFHRHLELHGLVLDQTEFQVSLAGDAVSHGMAESEEFVDRVKDLETLVYRTAERKLERPYRDAGRRRSALEKEVDLYLSIPRAASFAVTFRVGSSRQLAIEGQSFGAEVVDEVFDCLELINNSKFRDLAERISDSAYRRNFVNLTKKIAPDGRNISIVGFTALRKSAERRVEFTRTRDRIEDLEPERESSDLDREVTIRGTLKLADSLRKDEGRITLTDAGNLKYHIVVPKGMMSDIVRPLYEEEVELKAIRRDRKLHLIDIKATEE